MDLKTKIDETTSKESLPIRQDSDLNYNKEQDEPKEEHNISQSEARNEGQH